MRADIDYASRAIELLRILIERSPTDTQSRLRLMKLLFNKHSKHDFVIEAYDCAATCDLTIDQWKWLSEMGRSIDPDNGFFSCTPEIIVHPNGNGPTVTRSSVESRLSQESSRENHEPNTDLQVQNIEGVRDCSERRSGIERRIEDRRKALSPWYGEERRLNPRRLLRRRAGDTRA